MSKGTSFSRAFDTFFGGLASLGMTHSSIATKISDVSHELEKFRQKESEQRHAIERNVTQFEKELNEYKNNMSTAKANYFKAAKAAELAEQKRENEASNTKASDATSKALYLAKLNTKVIEAIDIFNRARELYLTSLSQLQSAELVHRDRMIKTMIQYEEIERERILEVRKEEMSCNDMEL